MENYI